MAGLDGSIQGQFALDVQGLDRLKHSAARDPQKQLRSAAEQFEAASEAAMEAGKTKLAMKLADRAAQLAPEDD